MTGSGVDPSAYAFALAPVLAATVVAPLLASLAGGPVVEAGPASLAGVVPLLAGLALAVWGVHSFATGGVVPAPATTPDRLVTDGALSYTRNPVYLGTVLATAGTALLSVSLVVAGYAAALWAVYHGVVVLREEPRLRADHRGWEDYADRVPRWLPRPRR